MSRSAVVASGPCRGSKIGSLLGVVKDSLSEWSADNALEMGAALAYYSIFSLGPILLLCVGIASLIFGQEAAQGKVLEQVGKSLGPTVAKGLADMLADGHQSGAGIVSTVVGGVTLLIGATGVMGQLQQSLNVIWKVQPKPGRMVHEIVRDRLLALLLVVAIGVLLLASLILSAVLTAATSAFTGGESASPVFWQWVDQIVTIVVAAVLFALVFRLLPDAVTSWKDIWVGAIVTSLLFTLGKWLLGLYLGQSGISSAYGAAGSLVLLLLWVYYSALIVLFGAELTYVYAWKVGHGVKPADNAVSTADEARSERRLKAARAPEANAPG